MNDSSTDETIEPITASADGKRNSYTLSCAPTGQGMNYAACLWRQGVLATPNVKTPADWAACDQARRSGTCTALEMRREEELAGKAIYFQDRNMVQRITAAAVRWILPTFRDKPADRARTPMPSGIEKRPESVKPRGAGMSMLDAMGSMGSLADAVTVAAKTAPSMPPAPRPVPVQVTAVALPGESPLQMARRIAAERAGHASA